MPLQSWTVEHAGIWGSQWHVPLTHSTCHTTESTSQLMPLQSLPVEHVLGVGGTSYTSTGGAGSDVTTSSTGTLGIQWHEPFTHSTCHITESQVMPSQSLEVEHALRFGDTSSTGAGALAANENGRPALTHLFG